MTAARPLRTALATTAVAATAATAAAAAPAGASTGDAIREGQRNGTATAETEIIGSLDATTTDKGGYVTRQSNVKTGSKAGGAAIYGCRTPNGGTAGGTAPCLRGSNLADGYAFEFQTLGLVAGLISVGTNPAVDNPNAKPFTTNATGVATGLNADRLDGKDAGDFLGKNDKAVSAGTADTATKATDSDKLGNIAAASYPSAISFTQTFAAASAFVAVKSFGNAELQARCFTAGANGFGQIQVVSGANGAQGDIHFSNAGVTTNVNSGLLAANTPLIANVLALGNFNSPGTGSARVSATAPDGTSLTATLGVVSQGAGSCKVSGFAMVA